MKKYGYIQGKSLGLTCEFGICQSKDVVDYRRKKEQEIKGWPEEKIALCKKHAKKLGYE